MKASGSLYYMIRHVFLPPRLPHEDDADPKHEADLLDALIQSIARFESLVAPDDKELTMSLLKTMRHLRLVHNENVAGGIDAAQLTIVVKDLCDEGDVQATICHDHHN